MRVTSNSFNTSLVDQLGSLTTRQARLQQQAATGQRVSTPEDDPTAMQLALNLDSESKRVGQYKSNINAQQQVGTMTIDTMKALKKISDRAGEIATLADGLKSPQELQVYSTEVRELIKQAVQLANTKNGANYILAGTKTDAAPFSATTDSSGQVTAVTYNGNTETADVEIAEGVKSSMQMLGANSSGSGPRGLLTDSRYGVDFFNHLISLQNHLQNGDAAAVKSTDFGNLSKDGDNFAYQFGWVGAMQSRLEATTALHNSRGTAIEAQVSSNVDADLAQTLVKLNETQNAYKAALQTAGTVLNLSLLDYLH